MKIYDKIYINGEWRTPNSTATHDIINPATEEVVARIPLSDAQDVNDAVAAAKAAFVTWGKTSAQERSELITAVAEKMSERRDDLAEAMSMSMGCPVEMTMGLQTVGPAYGMSTFAEKAKQMEEVKEVKNSLVVKEPVGVCAFINPWNYPLNQFVGKVAPALAAGCTMVVKPAEQTPLQDYIMAEIFHEVGLPAGVFNLVPGTGPEVGALMSEHKDVDMVSFTGSTRAGVMIAQAAAPSVKRVTQELGGKSPFIITAGANLEEAVEYGVEDVMINTGQTCTALTRMLVPAEQYEEAVAIAKKVAEAYTVGTGDAFMGPMVTELQKNRVLSYIEKGIEEGATLVTGGTDMPEGHDKGWYVKPTIFADVNNDMTIAKEEIFGPVLSMIPYDSLEEAVEIANDTPYGLSSGVYGKDRDEALGIARQIRAGLCFIQGGDFNYDAPFGGFKQSGNGREYGDEALHEFYEVKSIQM